MCMRRLLYKSSIIVKRCWRERGSSVLCKSSKKQYVCADVWLARAQVSLHTHDLCQCPNPILTFSFIVLVHVQAAEGRQEELTQRGAKEKRELELRIEEMEEKEQVLQARIEALQADNDFTNERLAALQGTDTHTHASSSLLLNTHTGLYNQASYTTFPLTASTLFGAATFWVFPL